MDKGTNLSDHVLKGALAFLTRQLLVRATGLLANIFLARLLAPQDFGVIATISLMTSIGGSVADAGLAASLVRSTEKPTPVEEATVFTAQLLLLSAVATIILLLEPVLAQVFRLPDNAHILTAVMAGSMVLTAFRAVPASRLERSLGFKQLAITEGVSSLIYQAAAVTLAWFHTGALALALAGLSAKLVEIVLINSLSPWKIKFELNVAALQSHLRFGLMYQGTGWVFLLRDAVNPVIIGFTAGSTAVGLVSFAMNLANYVHWFSSAVMGQIYFPLYSTLQGDKEMLKTCFEASVKWNSLVVLGLNSVLLPLSPYILFFVFGPKWMSSLPLWCAFSLCNLAYGIAGPGFALANAMGRADLNLRFWAVTVVVEWIACLLLVQSTGPMAVPLSHVCTIPVQFLFISSLRNLLSFSIGTMQLKLITCALLNGVTLYYLTQAMPPTGLPALIGYLLLGTMLFLIAINTLDRNAVYTELWQACKSMARPAAHS